MNARTPTFIPSSADLVAMIKVAEAKFDAAREISYPRSPDFRDHDRAYRLSWSERAMQDMRVGGDL